MNTEGPVEEEEEQEKEAKKEIEEQEEGQLLRERALCGRVCTLLLPCQLSLPECWVDIGRPTPC
jgi:hypothetical protein